MGSVKYIANSNEFWVNNLNDFKEGLEGYVGGEWESDVAYIYSDYKRRSKKALIKMDSTDFSIDLHKKDDYDDELDLLPYIQQHLALGSEAIIHLVEYEHPGDMSIIRYTVNHNNIKTEHILSN